MEKTLFTMGFGSMWNCIAGVEELVTIASCVGGCGLAAVCKLLAEDFSGWAGVLPIHVCVCVTHGPWILYIMLSHELLCCFVKLYCC